MSPNTNTLDQLEEQARKPRKPQRQMRVSGKRVFQLKRVINKRVKRKNV